MFEKIKDFLTEETDVPNWALIFVILVLVLNMITIITK